MSSTESDAIPHSSSSKLPSNDTLSTTPSIESTKFAATAASRAAVRDALASAGGHTASQAAQWRQHDTHANAAAIERQRAELERNTAELARESEKLQKELDKGAQELKAYGDLQTWAESMERDFLVLEETLRLAEGREEEESASGGSQWKG